MLVLAQTTTLVSGSVSGGPFSGEDLGVLAIKGSIGLLAGQMQGHLFFNCCEPTQVGEGGMPACTPTLTTN